MVKKLTKSVPAALTLAALLAGPGIASAASAGDWIARAGITHVSPNENTKHASGQLAGTLDGSDVDVSSDTQLGLTLSYMVTDTVAVELLAATPFEHDLSISGGALGGTDLGKVKELPPTLSVQYHFDTATPLRPYVGAGVNYTTFFDEKVDSEAKAVGVTDIKLDDSFGLAAQIGADYDLGNNWMVNADLRYIQIDTTAKVRTATGRTDVDVDINPWVYTLAAGYRF